MSTTICLGANTFFYPEGGGHQWVYLNWALGARALGCEVIWLEVISLKTDVQKTRTKIAALKKRLEPYGLDRSLALCSRTAEPLPPELAEASLGLDAAAEADLLLNLRYDTPFSVVQRFHRSALVDIDPGLLQVWMSAGQINVAHHDVYFTIGETVGQPGGRIPDVGLRWQYTPPCVALEWWPPQRAAADAPFTTVSQWATYDEWMEDAGEVYSNDKRAGFLPLLDLPRHTAQPLELALCLSKYEDHERAMLRERGWRVRESHEVASTPWSYQSYIQSSRGEFSCVKPSCVRLQNAWISDRTICYLASGKPAVIEHTGSSRFLPDAAGLFRFRNLNDAIGCLARVAADYERQCGMARALAEEYFDARKVVGSVLERALA